MKNSNRIVFIDYVRVIACFLVMLVHASENFYCISADTTMLANESNRFWVAFYDGALGRMSVPLFMVVSAFLLVPVKPNVSMSDFYKHRFKRIIPPLVFFMLIYCFLPLAWGQMTWEQSWQDFRLLPFTFPSMAGHLWFMYPLISLYLIIPVVSPWLERASAKEERLFLIFFMLSTLVPWLTRFVSSNLWGTCFWHPYFGMFYYCSGYLGYLVMAHYIRVHLKWDRAKRLKVGIGSFVAGAAFTAWSAWHAGVPGIVMQTPSYEWSWEFCTPNVLLATFGAFLMFTCIKRQEAHPWITGISKLTFGMYPMHILFLSNIAPLFMPEGAAQPVLPVAVTIPCMAVLCFVCCVVTTKLISLIPGSKWIIG